MPAAPTSRFCAPLPAPRALSALVFGVALGAPLVAWADAASDQSVAKELSTPAERRSGFVFGFGVGTGWAGASGYPNSSSKIGDSRYYDAADALGGVGGAIFAQGALKDWLSFGVFYQRANFRSANWNTYGGGGGFRVDLFPLYRLYPRLRDLGVYGQFGVGTSTLSPNYGSRESASGTESFLGGGVFYEFFLGKASGGHWAAGPTLEWDSQITQSNERHSLLVGGRVAFYTGR